VRYQLVAKAAESARRTAAAIEKSLLVFGGFLAVRARRGKV